MMKETSRLFGSCAAQACNHEPLQFGAGNSVLLRRDEYKFIFRDAFAYVSRCDYCATHTIHFIR